MTHEIEMFRWKSDRVPWEEPHRQEAFAKPVEAIFKKWANRMQANYAVRMMATTDLRYMADCTVLNDRDRESCEFDWKVSR